jgi:hypothetical protein
VSANVAAASSLVFLEDCMRQYLYRSCFFMFTLMRTFAWFSDIVSYAINSQRGISSFPLGESS